MAGYSIFSTKGVMKDVNGKELIYKTYEEAALHAANMSRIFGERFFAHYCD